MARYKIVESVGKRLEDVHSYEDLEIHHPSRNSAGLKTGRAQDFEPGRTHKKVDGAFEEVRSQGDGRLLVKKDFVLSHDGSGPVAIPAPVEGYVHYLHDKTATMRVYDRPSREPGAKLLAQVLHMDPNSFHLREGERVAYGQPMGVMSDTGTPRVVHAHVEAEPHQFRKYIQDIDSGAIAPDRYPSKGLALPHPPNPGFMESPVPAAVYGLLDQGVQGLQVESLQQSLSHLGYRDANGHPLKVDGDFGERTKQAVQAFQRANDLEPDGIAGPRTQAALRAVERQLLTHAQHPHHGLFRNAMEKVHGAEFQRQIAPGPHSERLAAALTVEALREGLTRIDRVEFNDRGTLARAVQLHPLRDESGLNRSTDGIGTQQASTQSLLQSSQQAQQVASRAHEAQRPQAELERAHLRSAALP